MICFPKITHNFNQFIPKERFSTTTARTINSFFERKQILNTNASYCFQSAHFMPLKI